MNLSSYKALLFDCDGTIADSMPLHFKAWNLALKKSRAHLPEDLHYAWAGRPSERIAELLNQKFGWNLDPRQTALDKETEYLAILHEVQPVPQIVEIIRLYDGKLPMAVVSGSPNASIKKTLGHLGLGREFQTIVGAEDYAKGKPAPDCFLEAARRLNVGPKGCLVFEDAELGIQAAVAAGMDWAKIDPRTGITWGKK
jgi:HAD superfamily hydrolase (TIGR01509 family)